MMSLYVLWVALERWQTRVNDGAKAYIHFTKCVYINTKFKLEFELDIFVFLD